MPERRDGAFAPPIDDGKPSSAALPLAKPKGAVMDLNYLISREQIERSRAQSAGHPRARAVHGELADMFRDRIDFRRRALFGALGLGAALNPPRL